MHHPLLTSERPPLPQQTQQIGREQGVGVLASLAALDPKQHALAVDVGDLQYRDFCDAKAGAVGYR